MKLERKQLPHDIPPWVAEDSRYFITINNAKRNSDHLVRPGVAEKLLQSIQVYESINKWHVQLFVIMPDHLHLIASFGKTHGIRQVISSWKSYHAKTLSIDWQYNYFEHRLRNEDEFTEKFYYVLLNPVRKGLVNDWQEWPHKFVRGQWT